MSRYVNELNVTKSVDECAYIVQEIMRIEGFEFVEYKGEQVWKKGMGLMTAPQFIKIGFMPGRVHIEAWLRYALLPGVYVGEMGLDGFFGIALKKMLQGRVRKIEEQLSLQY